MNLVCPSLRMNDGHVERILARENEIRHRLRMAAVRAANFPTPGQLSYLVRTNGMHVTNRGARRRTGLTEEEAMQEATTRWFIAEHLGVLTRVAAPQPLEYVLKTRTFNAERERARRSQMRRLRTESTAACDEDRINDLPLVSTPKKLAATIEGGGPSTPETVATTLSDIDDGQPTLADTSDAGDTECVSSANTSQNVCPVCPEDDDTFECTICLTEIEDGEQVGVLPCTHIYHVDCLRQWISRKNSCPLCQVTEIASPRPVEMAGDIGGSSFPTEEDTPPSERNAPGNVEGTNGNLGTNNAQNNTSQNSTNWFMRTFLQPASDTSTLVESELRSYQDQRRRRHWHRQREAGRHPFY